MSVDKIGGPTGPVAPSPRRRRVVPDPAFDRALDHLLQAPPPQEPAIQPAGRGLKLSRHAQARIESRRMEFGEQEQSRLSDAIDELSAKGARQALVLTGENAWIVGVPQRTVITAMPRDEALGTVFTQIDAVAIRDR